MQAELEVQRAAGNPQESGGSLQAALQLDFSLACSLSPDPQASGLFLIDSVGNPQESGESLQAALQLDFSLACSLSPDLQARGTKIHFVLYPKTRVLFIL